VTDPMDAYVILKDLNIPADQLLTVAYEEFGNLKIEEINQASQVYRWQIIQRMKERKITKDRKSQSQDNLMKLVRRNTEEKLKDNPRKDRSLKKAILHKLFDKKDPQNKEQVETEENPKYTASGADPTRRMSDSRPKSFDQTYQENKDLYNKKLLLSKDKPFWTPDRKDETKH